MKRYAMNMAMLVAIACLLLPSRRSIAATKRVPVDGIEAIEVKLGKIGIKIQADGGSEIVMEAGPDLERAVSVSGGKLRLASKPGGTKDELDLGDLVVVKMPAGIAVEVATASGDIEISGLRAKLRAGTASGSLKVTDCRGAVSVRGVSGDIVLENVEGDINVSAVSGTVRARGIRSALLEAQTVSGGLELDASGVERVRTRAVSGDMVLSGRPVRGASLVASSVSGDIEIRLPADTGFELSFGSVSGSFSTDFTGTREKKGKKLRFRTGDGSVSIKVGTVSGDLTVKKLH